MFVKVKNRKDRTVHVNLDRISCISDEVVINDVEYYGTLDMADGFVIKLAKGEYQKLIQEVEKIARLNK